MRWLRRIWQKSLTEKRLDSELQFHLEQRIAQSVASGMSPEEARREANLEFGGMERFKEECRESRWENHFEIFFRDLHFALRGLLKDRRFTFIAVLALALGIGSSTAIFSVIYNGLIAPFPYKDAKHLVTLKIRDLDQGEYNFRSVLSYPEFQDFMQQSKSFDSVIGNCQDDVIYEAGQNNFRFASNYVTPNSFETLGVPPFLGRNLEPSDYQAGAPPVFVMRHSVWVAKFGSDPSLIGKSFVMDGIHRTLVGIAGPRFAWGGVDFWFPQTPGARKTRSVGAFEPYWGMLAHLKPGVSTSQVEAEMNVIAQNLSKKYDKDYPRHFHVQVDTLAHAVVGAYFRKTVFILFAAVVLLLLIGCANVANLLLARSTIRGREFAVRAALGASRSRLVRQLLSESLLLALTSAVVGIFFAWIGVRLLSAGMPAFTVPSETVIELNVYVLLFAILIAIATVVIFGLFPAIQASQSEPQDTLRESGRGLGGTNTKSRLRNTVIVMEVAMSLILLFTAGLFMRTFYALQGVQLGLNTDHVLSTYVMLAGDLFKTPEQVTNFYRPLLERLRSVPGIESVSVMTSIPPYGGIETDVHVPGAVHDEKKSTIFQFSSEDFFSILRIPFLSGRTFTADEVNHGRKVAVINQKFQHDYFPNQDPLGRTISVEELKTFPFPVPDPSFEIIGVVADTKNDSVENPIRPEIWIPYNLTGPAGRGLLIRTNEDSLAIRNEISHAVWSTDSRVALMDIRPISQVIETASYAIPRFSFYIVSTFAVIGLILVTIGVYSVIAYNTAQRTHEIGIRVALGAVEGDVLTMVLRQGFTVLAMGIALGIVASLVLTRVLSSLLWGVSPRDPATAGIVVALLLFIGLLACWIPARRATRVDPMTALRYE